MSVTLNFEFHLKEWHKKDFKPEPIMEEIFRHWWATKGEFEINEIVKKEVTEKFKAYREHLQKMQSDIMNMSEKDKKFLIDLNKETP